MKLSILAEGVVSKNPHPSVRPQVAWHGHNVNLGGGELLHAALVGPAKISLHSRCRIYRSRDHGVNWEETTPLVAETEIDSSYAYFTGLLGRTGDGTVWATSQRFVQVEPEDPRWTPDSGGWLDGQPFVCRSADGGQSWSHPDFVSPSASAGAFPTLATPVLELPSGELMLVYEAFFTETMAAMQHRVTALFSDDGGETWGDERVIAEDPHGRLIYFDPRLALLPDGRLVGLFWTHDKNTDEALNTTVAWSDDGHSWSVPQPTELWGFPTLPLTLADGRLFAVYNYRRNPQGVRCAVSEDAGRSWDMDHEYTLWDQQARQVTGELASAGAKRDWEGSALAEMWSWDFGVPDPLLLDDGSVLVTFYATELDHVLHQRWVRLRIE